MLKKFVGGADTKATALAVAQNKIAVEHKNAEQTEKNSKYDTVPISHQQFLLALRQKQMCTISQSTVSVGKGTIKRPVDFLLSLMKRATEVSVRFKKNQMCRNIQMYLLIRGNGNNQNCVNDANNNQIAQNRTIAYSNVLSTKNKAVSCYVKYCVEKHLTKSMALQDTDLQKSLVITQMGTLGQECEKLLFNSSVTYLIACHVTKRLLQHMDELEFHAFQEFATSHNANLICFPPLSAISNTSARQESETSMGCLLNPESTDRLFTAVPLEQARRVNLSTAYSNIRDQFYTLISKVAVSFFCFKITLFTLYAVLPSSVN